MTSAWVNRSLMGLPWLTEVYRTFTPACLLTVQCFGLVQYCKQYLYIPFNRQHISDYKAWDYKRAISEQWEGLGTRLRDSVKLFHIGLLLMLHHVSFVWTPCVFSITRSPITCLRNKVNLVWSYNHRDMGPCLRRELAARTGTNCHRITVCSVHPQN